MLRQVLGYKAAPPFLGIDFLSGAVVAICLATGGLANHKLIPGLGVLYAEIALGATLLSVALVALSVVVAFLGQRFLELLQDKGALGHPFNPIIPYQIVAVISAIDVFVAIIAIFTWPIAPIWLAGIASASVAGLTTWAVVGTVLLVNLTASLANFPSQIHAAIKDLDGNRPEMLLRSADDPQANQSPADTPPPRC